MTNPIKEILEFEVNWNFNYSQARCSFKIELEGGYIMHGDNLIGNVFVIKKENDKK